MNLLPPLALLVVVLFVPPALAGTAGHPEIKDPAGDAGPIDGLDITAVYIDTPHPDTVTFHILVKSLPPPTVPPPVPSPPVPPAGACSDAACAGGGLRFKLEFRVLDPKGQAAPQLDGYDHTLLVFRWDAPAGLQSDIGYVDRAGNIVYNGTFSGKTVGNEIVLEVPRTHGEMAIPSGAAPGAYRLNQTVATSSPQACILVPDVSQIRLTCQYVLEPGAGSTTNDWDRAPDTGYGKDFVFPSHLANQTAPESNSTLDLNGQSPDEPSGPDSPPADTGTGSATLGPTSGKATATKPGGKSAPGLEMAVILVGVAALAALRRRV